MKMISLSLFILMNFKNFTMLIFMFTFLLIYFSMILSSFMNPMIFSNNIFSDMTSFLLIFLSIMSIILIILSSSNFKNISFLMMMLFFLLMLTFMMNNMLYFYIMFEMILIPTMILITQSGYQPERLQAGIYLLIYTIFASLPLLLSIINLKNNPYFFYSSIMSKFISYPMIFLLAFLVKLPMFFFHLWLPKAHVEAPVEGSMILAAILLKLGGYGIIRFSSLMINNINKFNFWLISLSMLGATTTSLNCIRQKDLKSLIAYSSVAHMGFILASMMTFNTTGMSGSLMMMIAHGFASSALFLLVNLIYTKYHTRNIISFKGLMNSYPNLMFWWFIFMAINISAPPSINVISEILLMSSIIQWNLSLIMLIFFLSISTTTFSIFMFVNIAHNYIELLPSNNNNSKMFLSLMLHLTPLIMLIFKIESILILS